MTNLSDIVGTKFVEGTYSEKKLEKRVELFDYTVKENIESAKSSSSKGRWSVLDGGQVFTESPDMSDQLPKGVYCAEQDMSGRVYLCKMDIKCDNLITMPDDPSGEIVAHVKEFWTLKEQYNTFGFLHKRGILLYGPQGSGKTGSILLTIKTLIEADGLVLLGDFPPCDSKALQMIRRLEAERPIVVVYEDVDETVARYGDRRLTSLLDGENNVDNVLYLATTNYPEYLPPRLINRPSRFDVRKYVGLPSEAARAKFLEIKTKMAPSEIKVWASKTDGLTFAHLKELIVLVKILNKSLDDSIVVLKAMKVIPNSSDYSLER
jgi:hypothetical protein